MKLFFSFSPPLWDLRFLFPLQLAFYIFLALSQSVAFAIVEWLWGGFSVDNATLNRFFSLHYLMPFLIAGLT